MKESIIAILIIFGILGGILFIPWYKATFSITIIKALRWECEQRGGKYNSVLGVVKDWNERCIKN